MVGVLRARVGTNWVDINRSTYRGPWDVAGSYQYDDVVEHFGGHWVLADVLATSAAPIVGVEPGVGTNQWLLTGDVPVMTTLQKDAWIAAVAPAVGGPQNGNLVWDSDVEQLFVYEVDLIAAPPTAAWIPVGTETVVPDEVWVGVTPPMALGTEVWYDTSTTPGTLYLKRDDTGNWEPVGGPDAVIPNEVWVGAVPPRDIQTELWHDTGTTPGVFKAKRDDTGEWESINVPPGIVPDEVWVGTVVPRDINNELWYDTGTTPGVLKARRDDTGEWEPMGAADVHVPDEVWVGSVPPRDQDNEVWYDTSTTPGILKVRRDDTGVWEPLEVLSEVSVGHEDPRAAGGEDEVWYDTGSGVPGTFKVWTGSQWVEIPPYGTTSITTQYGIPYRFGTQNVAAPADHIHGTPPEEVRVNDRDPYTTDPDSQMELWYDTTTETLNVRIDDAWVPVTSPDDPIFNEVHVGPSQPTDIATELWYDTTDDPGTLKVHIGDEWVPIESAEEVSVGHTDPRTDPDSTTDLWYDTSTGVPGELKVWTGGQWVEIPQFGTTSITTQYGIPYRFGTQRSAAPSDHIHGTPPEEVVVGDDDPLTVDPLKPDTDVWFDTSSDPGTLKINVNGSWVQASPDQLNEVLVSPAQPSDITTELWVDPTPVPPTLRANIGGAWVEIAASEVEVGTEDPYLVPGVVSQAQLWQDMNLGQNGMLKVRIGNNWRPVAELAQSEVEISVTDPQVAITGQTPPNRAAELWVDTSTTPVQLKGWVNGAWVTIAGNETPPAPQEVEIGPARPRETTVELWYDTTTSPGVLKANNFGTWEEISASEVSVGHVDPNPDPAGATHDLWYDTSKGVPGDLKAWVGDPGRWQNVVNFATGVAWEQQYGQEPRAGTLETVAREDHTHGTPPEEVRVDDTDPYDNPDSQAELWYDTTTGTLNVRVGDTWQPVTSPDDPIFNEVHVGPSQPSDIATELWFDTTTDPGVLKANVEGVWTPIETGSEVEINNIDPYLTDPASTAELWFNPSMEELSARFNNHGCRSTPTLPTSSSLRELSPPTPTPNSRYNTSTTPGTMMVKVAQQWVPAGASADEVWVNIAEPADPGIELWYDPDDVSGPSGAVVPNEVWVGSDNPADPNVELWYDMDAVAPLMPKELPPAGAGGDPLIESSAPPTVTSAGTAT